MSLSLATAQPAVIPTLGHDRPTVREASLVAIHELVRHGSRHVADSILSAVAVHGLEHDDPIVRAHACNALASGTHGGSNAGANHYSATRLAQYDERASFSTDPQDENSGRTSGDIPHEKCEITLSHTP